jgi:polysaccharide deacetylase 2 family uncharacterized protein YibQ
MPRAPYGLLVWIALACLAFAFAPLPPAAPPMAADEIASTQRAIDRLVADTRTWQSERGDRTIPWEDASGHLAIVIDDVGRELHLFDQLLGLRWQLSFSVLPGAVYAPGAQLRLRADRRRYREILLHLPMEPEDATQMRGGDEAREVFLRMGDGADVLRGKVEAALAHVPAAIGVNNHMGSRLTTDRAAMDMVMAVLAERGLYFLDSRTAPQTVAERAALDAGVPAIARRVFLDEDPTEAAIEAALGHAAELARTEPTVVIGHPSPELVAVLQRRLPQLHAVGIGVYPLSTLLRRRAPAPSPSAAHGRRDGAQVQQHEAAAISPY